MATDKQIEANRLNSQKSTGPKTPEGKAASAHNACRHGLLAKSVLIKGESPERFEQSLIDIRKLFKPKTRTEFGFVESMAVARWRHMRYVNMEAAMCTHHMTTNEMTANKTDDVTNPILDEEEIKLQHGIAFQSLADKSSFLPMLNRFQTSADRQYGRAISNLLMLQRARRKKDKDAESLAPDGVVLPEDLYNQSGKSK